MMPTPPINADRSQQGPRFRRTVLGKMDRLFRGKTFDIEKTISLPEGQVFYTVFGRPCRSGYVIRCRETGERFAVGFKTLRHIHDLYLGVNLPHRLRPKVSDDPVGPTTDPVTDPADESP
jgi:hypothetical protein